MNKVTALERLGLRLSHMADGVDEEVDEVLAMIRGALKDGGDAKRIDELSGRLARTLMAATGVNADVGRRVEGGYDLSGVRKLIRSLPVRGDEQARMGQLVEQASKGSTALARQKALVDLLETAATAIREISTRDKGDSGMLGWLGKKGASSEGEGDYARLFAGLLERLVEHIEILNGNPISGQDIRESLPQLSHPEQARGVVEEVTREIEAIDARVRAERNDTTDFLGALRERLDGFEEVLGLLSGDNDESLRRTEDLQAQVGDDTREIGEAAKTDDINAMRGLIHQGLGRITERLAEHVLAEREQHQASKARVEELNSRLERLESEADTLRSEIRSKSDLALKDALTGVYNRAGYEERANELYARWQRSGAALSLVFVDCNDFKGINDNYGHAAGDLVLMKIAEALQNRARASDIVCRYGGDEFVILLPDTHSNGAEVFARSASESVLNAGFNDNGKPLDVSISCGITELIAGDTMESAMGRADEAMYKAKSMKGIRVAVVV